MIRAVRTHELRMSAPGQFRPRWLEPGMVEVRRIGLPQPDYARFLYLAIGGRWFWVERSGWSRDRWRDHLATPGVELHVGYLDGAPFGYHELHFRADGRALLAYFGIFPEFIGHGRGAHLLSHAIRHCWDARVEEIQVYTCELDHPHALPNYVARGFTQRAVWVENRHLPAHAPDFWTAAGR